MILTQCAVCAVDLGLTLGKKCGRCSTRYCGQACQVQHWKEGGHDTLCKPIKKAGGAEQYNADKKYKEAVAEAVEECAEDTKGQTCYICTEAVHWKTKEGLVRGCACRGASGFVHVSCLVEQAKIWNDEAEENNLDDERADARWLQWLKCSVCEQHYHGVVEHALGWACWKTYLGRPETDASRQCALGLLGEGLIANRDFQTALAVFEAKLDMQRRLWPSRDVLRVETNIAECYAALGRHEEAINRRRAIYDKCLAKDGPTGERVIVYGLELARSLVGDYFFAEAKTFLRDLIPKAESVFGNQDHDTLILQVLYAEAVHKDADSSLDEQREAIAMLEDSHRIARQVYGASHPRCEDAEQTLESARKRLSAQEARLVEDASEKLAQGLRIDGDDESDAP